MPRTNKYTVFGRIANKQDKPLAGLVVRAFDQDPNLPDDPLGQPAVTNAEGLFRIPYDDVDFRTGDSESGGAEVVVRVYGVDQLLVESKVVQNAPLSLEVNLIVEEVPALEIRQLKGAVRSADGKAAAGVTLQVWRRDLFGQVFLGTTVADGNGLFTAKYRVLGGGETPPFLDLAIKVYEPDGTLLEECPAIYNTPKDYTLAVTLSKAPAQLTEHECLLADVRPHVGSRPLSELREAKGQGQLSLLTGKTGWDARAIAMAATAEKAAADTGIPAAHWYALFRCGVPYTPEAINALAPDELGNAVKKAGEEGVIPPVSASALADTVSKHRARAAEFVLARKPAAGVSALGDLLNLRLSTAQKQTFAEVFQAHQGDSAAFWSTLGQKGFSAKTIEQLQLDGKLAYLTLHNQPVVKKLQQKQIGKPEDLARQGYYTAAAWKTLVGTAVPKGLSADEYAGHLAAMVKRSYPTETLGAMLRRGDLKMGGDANALTETAAFFENNTDHLKIGAKPLKKTAAFQQLSANAQALALRVERLYQITPDDDALKTLAETGVHSARQIAQYSRREFLKRFGTQFKDPETASTVYTRAHEVHSTALNLTAAYLTHRTRPKVYALSGGGAPVQAAHKAPGLPPALPTLETIFGEMDYCSCEHCRSVLSPAAYLVDLLRFLTVDKQTLEEGKKSPIEVLLGRRPDIEHIRLNCENTNTVLPYIDLVNEILEHYALLAVDGHVDNWGNYKGYNIEPGVQTEDLLADPAFVKDVVYQDERLVSGAVFPLGLPFDRPLEGMRLLFQLWDVRYDEALEALNQNAEARREALGLSPRELDIFTGSDGQALPEYFGEGAGLNIQGLNAAIGNAVTFSRRMDISYAELAALLKMRFINPFAASGDLAKLDRLNLSFADIKRYHDGALTEQGLQGLLPADILTLDYGPGTVGQWINERYTSIMSMILLSETGANASPCSFSNMELRRALPVLNQNQLTELDFHKLHRFIRLWKKTGWSMETTDLALVALSDISPENIAELPQLDAIFTQVLARAGHVARLQRLLNLGDKKIPELLGLWDIRTEAGVRRALWSRLLRLRTEDFNILAALAAFDPSLPLEADNPPALRFVRAVLQFKTTGMKAADLDFLLRHQDPGGKLSLSTSMCFQTVQSLRAALAAVEATFGVAVPEADLAFVHSRLALAFESGAVDAFMALLDNSVVFEEALAWPAEVLPDALLLPASFFYDDFRKTLSVRGIFLEAERLDLQNRVDTLSLPGDFPAGTSPADAANLKTQLGAALQHLRQSGEEALDALFSRYTELRTAYDAYRAAPEAGKTTALLGALLPDLRVRMHRQAIEQALAAAFKTDVPTIVQVAGNADVLHAPDNPGQPMTDTFLALGEGIAPALNADGVLDFYFTAPISANYTVWVNAPENTEVQLDIDGTIVIDGALGPDGELSNTAALEFKAGQLYRLNCQISGLSAGASARIRWQTPGTAKTELLAPRCIPARNVEQALIALARLHKAVQWQRLLKISGAELAHLGQTFTINGQGWMNALPTDGNIQPADLAALWQTTLRLSGFVALKMAFNAGDDAWLTILNNPDADAPSGKKWLEELTGWRMSDVDALLAHFQWVRTDLKYPDNLFRLKTALDIVARTGFPAQNILTWTALPDGTLFSEAKTAVRAQIGEQAWLESAPRISDPLRKRQRDALVQWILHFHPPTPAVDTPDKLYEHFLIDVEMDACMKTSRIKQAISTVQLFVHRCLLNLEPDVSPDSIDGRQWAWMKRYRVWEANRKIFLYPENWLEPEFRDNKSYLFRELEGELLKADITDELAEAAYLNYLKKLDDIARLDVCGMYLEEQGKGNQYDDILHVFARSIGEERRYYYRRFEGGNWSPWEKVDAPIKGEHIFPVVWKGRLMVFWLTVFQRGAAPDGNRTFETMREDTDWNENARVDVEITFCWAEYSKGRWVSPKSGEMRNPVKIENLSRFDSKQLLVSVQKVPNNENIQKAGEKIVFQIAYALNQLNWGYFYSVLFFSKNAPPVIENGWKHTTLNDSVVIYNYYLFETTYNHSNDIARDHGFLQIHEQRELKVGISGIQNADAVADSLSILRLDTELPAEFRLLPLHHSLENQREAPFFFLDSQRVFSVMPEEEVFPFIQDWNGYMDIDFDQGGWRAIKPRVEIAPLVEIPGMRQPGMREPEFNPDTPAPDEWAVNVKILEITKGFAYDGVVLDRFGERLSEGMLGGG